MRLLRIASVISLSLVAMTAAQPALSKDLTADAVNAATFSHQALKSSSRMPLMVKLQMLLEVSLNTIIVQQRVVDIDQEDYGI